MTRKALLIVATAGSAALLLGALAFQYLGGLAPCHLCLQQRWPHAAAVVIGALAMVIPGRLLPYLGALAAAVTSGLGLYHTGVEQHWWQGPTTCTSGGIENLTPDQLMDQIMGAPLVQCDQVAWDMFGISMASWNMLISAGLVLVWLLAARASRAEA
ncbi:disulfide bond formation protein B [Frigidibacter sp. ROC022]|uniref:disulfide bond formation protein B n=1 Tax=Frigidibacter sp. ROC022 TaxID=2971796 RepID=UPI00215A9384|nr:disulfide bond formation protein B [Frigidibacter sp. ROC022]MCR8726385.1 disulfide bond formation protein B [Frigidibacter sp. ROC022]